MDEYVKKPHAKHSYSEKEIKELIKCNNDPLYFIENYVYIQTTSKGRQLFKLYDFQKKFIKQLNDYKYNIALMGRQMGKCLHGDTKIKIKNKKTGEIRELTIKEFFEMNDS
ncbi:MAG: hypothetical protein NZZ41_02140 [Candidatus Dojkabacteria bacterium]|nr:hypothetical protein [Candidatus Dojkabacteria bacterium]